MGSDAWLHWYWGTESKIEDDMPQLAKRLKDIGASKILDVRRQSLLLVRFHNSSDTERLPGTID